VVIGSEYQRQAGNGPASLKIVGQHGGRWVCQEIATFSSPFELTPIELHRDYGGDGEQITEINESAAWQRIGRRELRNAGIAAALKTRQAEQASETPEQQFARAEAEAADVG
jgi:hypothetical protein